MKYIILLGLLIIVIILAACGNGTANLTNDTTPTVSMNTPIPVVSSSPPVPSSSPLPVSSDSNLEKEDDSIRAIGDHSDGQLLIKPASKAFRRPLGAPSCIGLETDLHWSGDYEAVWKSKSEGTSTKVMTFPTEFGIVQKDETPVQMQEFSFEDTEIFAYSPRYTDCHALETYLFGVSDGKAFPISFEIKPNDIRPIIYRLPHHDLQAANGEFIVTGGYAAGMDFIEVYHFQYDSKKKSMILKSTDQVNPNDIIK